MVDIQNIEDASSGASNNLAVKGVSLAEGWLPSTVNNAVRAGWEILAKFYDDLGGTATVGGTANAISITTSGVRTALVTGVVIAFKNTFGPNTTAVTVNVDGLGAKAARLQGDVALVRNELVDDGVYLLRYDAAYNGATGAWIILNPSTHFSEYSPTLTNGANVASSASGACNYVRLGTSTTYLVYGAITVDPTSAATLTTIDLSLPVASDLGVSADLHGSGGTVTLDDNWVIAAEITNNRATMTVASITGAGSRTVTFMFTYRVI